MRTFSIFICFIITLINTSIASEKKEFLESNFIKNLNKNGDNYLFNINFKKVDKNFEKNQIDYEKTKLEISNSTAEEKIKIILNNLFSENEENLISIYQNGLANGSYRKFYHNNFENNPLEFLTLISSEIIHGNLDDNLNYEKKLEIFSKRKLIMTCGASTSFVSNILNFHNIKSRIVSTIVVENKNTYDDGHILLEIFVKDYNKWILIDFTHNVIFADKDNNYLSLFELNELDFDNVNIINLSNSPKYDFSSYIEYQFLQEYSLYNKHSWFKRIFETLTIYDDGIQYVLNDNIKDTKFKLLLSNYPDLIFLNKEKFYNYFYKM